MSRGSAARNASEVIASSSPDEADIDVANVVDNGGKDFTHALKHTAGSMLASLELTLRIPISHVLGARLHSPEALTRAVFAPDLSCSDNAEDDDRFGASRLGTCGALLQVPDWTPDQVGLTMRQVLLSGDREDRQKLASRIVTAHHGMAGMWGMAKEGDSGMYRISLVGNVSLLPEDAPTSMEQARGKSRAGSARTKMERVERMLQRKLGMTAE